MEGPVQRVARGGLNPDNRSDVESWSVACLIRPPHNTPPAKLACEERTGAQVGNEDSGEQPLPAADPERTRPL